MKQKKPLNLNPFVLIFAVVVVAWLFTFIITPGTLVDGVYTALPKNAFNFNNVFNLFRAVPMGIKDTSNLVILVLVIGGALEIYKSRHRRLPGLDRDPDPLRTPGGGYDPGTGI